MNLFKSFAVAAFFAASAFAQYSTPIRDIEHQVRNAVVVPYNCVNGGGATATCTTSYQIPVGYRLAVTQVSVITSGALSSGYNSAYFVVTGALSGTTVFNLAKLNTHASVQHNVSSECFFVVDSLTNASIWGPVASGSAQLNGYLYKM